MKLNGSWFNCGTMRCSGKVIAFLKMILLRLIFSAAILVFSPGCESRAVPPFPSAIEENSVVIYVAMYGGHSGIILPNKYLPANLRRLTSHFNTYRYIEFGWGDEDFYRSEKVGAFISIKAALWPTSSVLHVIGINETMEEYAATTIIYRIELSQQGFVALCDFIGSTFMQNEDGESIALGPDPAFVRPTLFYRSGLKFFFPRTCNTWTAKGLQRAGLPISIWGNICVKNLKKNTALLGNHVGSD